MGRKAFCGQSRSDVPRFQVRLQEVGGNRNKDESNDRGGKSKGHKEPGGVGDPAGFNRPLPRTERFSTVDADTHGNRVQGYHAHGSNKGLETDGRQFG